MPRRKIPIAVRSVLITCPWSGHTVGKNAITFNRDEVYTASCQWCNQVVHVDFTEQQYWIFGTHVKNEAPDYFNLVNNIINFVYSDKEDSFKLDMIKQSLTVMLPFESWHK